MFNENFRLNIAIIGAILLGGAIFHNHEKKFGTQSKLNQSYSTNSSSVTSLVENTKIDTRPTNSLAGWTVDDARTANIPSVYREKLYNPSPLGVDPTNSVPIGADTQRLESLLLSGANKVNTALRFNRDTNGNPNTLHFEDIRYVVKSTGVTHIQFCAGTNADWRQCLSLDKEGTLDQYIDDTWTEVRFRSTRYCDKGINPTLLYLQFARENNHLIGPDEAVAELKNSLAALGVSRTVLDSLKAYTFQDRMASDMPTPRHNIYLYRGDVEECTRNFHARAEFITCIPPRGGFGYVQINRRNLKIPILPTLEISQR